MEHVLQIAALRTLPTVARREDRPREIARFDAAFLQPLADGRANDESDRTEALH